MRIVPREHFLEIPRNSLIYLHAAENECKIVF